jgi:hypothetical protein
VLDDVLTYYDIERVIGERVRELVKVPHDIRFQAWVDVEGDGTYDFTMACSDVKDAGRIMRKLVGYSWR